MTLLLCAPSTVELAANGDTAPNVELRGARGPRGMIRFAHEGWDETAVPTCRREIMTLLAEWREFSNRN